MHKVRNIVFLPFFGRVLWLAFSVLFFYSGLYFTEWLFAPNAFTGGLLRWSLVTLFPLLVPMFFVINKRFGCASGSCVISADPDHSTKKRNAGMNITRMPGA